MPLELNQLRTFLEVVRQQSYSRAATQLHVTQSAVSHSIRKLEDSLGHPLVQWKARRLELTEQGYQLHHSCERIFREVEEVERLLDPALAGIKARIVLGAPVEFGTTVLIRKIAPLLREHPELHVDFLFSHDLTGPLLRDEIDLAVDCRPHTHPSVSSKPLFVETWTAVASPRLLEEHTLQVPLDLSLTPVISSDREAEWWNNLLQALNEEERPLFRRVIRINHIRGMINAAVEGLGVAFVPRYTVLREIESGSLKPLFPSLQLLDDHFRIVTKRSRGRRASIRIVADFLETIDASEYGDTIAQATGPSST